MYEPRSPPDGEDTAGTPQVNGDTFSLQVTSHPSAVEDGARGSDGIGRSTAQGSTRRSPGSTNFEGGEGNLDDASNGSQTLHQPASTTCEPSAQPIPFLLFSVEYKPEGISPGLAPPLTLPAVLAVIEQLRAPPDHRRAPRLLPVHPQPPGMPAVLLALPSWPAESVTILFDCHVTARRTFADAVPRFFSRGDVLTMAKIDPSTPCHVFHRDVPWPIPEGSGSIPVTVTG